MRGYGEPAIGLRKKFYWTILYIAPWFVIGFGCAILLRNISIKNDSHHVNSSQVTFNWETLPWVENKKLESATTPTYRIKLHGEFTPEVENIYTGSLKITEPEYANVANTYLTPEGYAVHSDSPYPLDNTWFPKFDLENYSKSCTSKNVFPQLISLPYPNHMSDASFISNILPLLYNIPEELLGPSKILISEVSPALTRFLNDIKFPMENTVTFRNCKIKAENALIPRIKGVHHVSQAATIQFRKYIHSLIENVPFANIIIARDGDPKLRRREYITQKLASQSEYNRPMDKMWTLSEQISAFANSQIAVGFGGDQLGLAAFMRDGSTVIEIQRDDVVSRSALLAQAMGLRVHVIAVKDVIGEDVIQTINSIVADIQQ